VELNHVVTQASWADAAGLEAYAPPSLRAEGFLHCCTPAQLRFVLARHFAGATGLLVLTFDTEDVPAEVRWVHSEPDQDPFPHLFGPIPLRAIRTVTPIG
jgi:uncharacterized protein (DUF952 family)